MTAVSGYFGLGSHHPDAVIAQVYPKLNSRCVAVIADEPISNV